MLFYMKVHKRRTSPALNIDLPHRWIIVIAIGGLIAASALRASDLDETGGDILPTRSPALSANWAAEYCDFIAEHRVTVGTSTLSGYSSDYIALANEVDRTVANAAGNGYIWLAVGRAKDRERREDIWEPFVEIETWECEELPWKNWQEKMREHWPELAEDK